MTHQVPLHLCAWSGASRGIVIWSAVARHRFGFFFQEQQSKKPKAVSSNRTPKIQSGGETPHSKKLAILPICAWSCKIRAVKAIYLGQRRVHRPTRPACLARRIYENSQVMYAEPAYRWLDGLCRLRR